MLNSKFVVTNVSELGLSGGNSELWLLPSNSQHQPLLLFSPQNKLTLNPIFHLRINKSPKIN